MADGFDPTPQEINGAMIVALRELVDTIQKLNRNFVVLAAFIFGFQVLFGAGLGSLIIWQASINAAQQEQQAQTNASQMQTIVSEVMRVVRKDTRSIEDIRERISNMKQEQTVTVERARSREDTAHDIAEKLIQQRTNQTHQTKDE